MYTIGIDVGGMSLVAGVVTREGKLLGKASLPTRQDTDPQLLADDLIAIAREACVKANVDTADIDAIGLGFPGSVDADTVIYCCNIPSLQEPVKLPAMMRKQWDVPIALENDANAAALGEAKVGSAKGCDDVLFITLGTGVGGGIVIGGKVYAGFNHLGGELGHMVIVYDGEPCGCGRKGCWESYASATALMRMTREAMEAYPDSRLWRQVKTLDGVSGRTAFDAMRDGDEIAKGVVLQYMEMLGCGLANMINILEPEVVCIGGGIANEGDALIVPLTAIVERESYNKTAKKAVIRTAALGNDAGVIGAALVAVG
ncbi:MAG: ROK family protein [Oscillospiraceae bacterium]|nr:ROK family protein [Oscillospiraceae bacterium]